MKYNTRKDSYVIEESKIDFFINVGLQVTRRCNLKCIHCCESSQEKEPSLGDVKKIIDELVDNGLRKICITGGEPLLRNDLFEILKYAKGKGIYVTLSTNGILVNENVLEKIKPYIDNIRFSLHGMEKKHVEVTNNKNSFKIVSDSIKLSNRLKIPISIVMSVIRHNYSDMLKLAKFCEENHVEKLYFFSLISRGRGVEIYGKEYVSHDKIQEKCNEIKILARKNNWNMDMNTADWSKEGQCVLVFPNGTVAGVPSFKDKENTRIIGNILDGEPHLLWDEYEFKENYIKYYKNH